MTNPLVTPESVEAAARACFKAEKPGQNPGNLTLYELQAQVALEAAAPHMIDAMRDAVEYIEAQLRGGVAVGAVPAENVLRAYQKAEELLDSLEAATNE